MVTTYRADNVGSLLRPPALLQARAAHEQGRLTLAQLRQSEDTAILQALELQRQVGLDVYTDGEYRRAEFRSVFDQAVEGLPYIQVDAPRYTYFVDERWRQRFRDRGKDPDVVIDDWIAADNASLADINPQGTTIAIHLCRGNNRGAWFGEGSYAPIAEKLFNAIICERFLLEFDSARSGGFAPLQRVPRHKIVVLGLITTKTGAMEQVDDLLRRIDEAVQHFPMENLALSPQCGFATFAAGNPLSWDEQRRKLELVVETTARRAWG
jgi:methionine synthase II (cobalamin-independent)